LTKKYRISNACKDFYLIQLSNYREASALGGKVNAKTSLLFQNSVVVYF